MDLQHNVSLKPYNTFGIDVNATSFISVTSEDELISVLKKNYAETLFILGGGSNMLLTEDIENTVVHLNLLGKTIVSEDNTSMTIDVSAGENWHQFVLWTLDKNLGGLENLSLIPGNVGTSPIQNIGAYGVELKDSFVSCDAIHKQTLVTKTFSKKDCEFGYRSSVFKTSLKGDYIITKVRFKLNKAPHLLSTNYGIIEQELERNKITEPTIQDVSNAVIAIRSSKLPNPNVLGNSGSFFKNPIIPINTFKTLKANHEHLPSYPVSEEFVKVPAGWLIDQSGLKGFREGDAGVHKNQALVLVNYGNASGQDILNLAKKVQDIVYQKFSIRLEPEVNIYN
ncbi:UDP-N-acetylmuramate dehydrogenase [Croceibacter atlanticus]|uniref:UDP-N-acetylmuramate dehydrogenase n=1 Tax=Croceibacter atlanticus TaxID=313588 RepID=UPI002E166473|nr:UDP-N-acetylmuramate dehydrogenase [Croceibacter atlanticus]